MCRQLAGGCVGPGGREEATRVHEVAVPLGPSQGQMAALTLSLLDQGLGDELANARACLASAVEQHRLVPQLVAVGAQGRQNAGQGDAGGALRACKATILFVLLLECSF